MNPRIKRVSTKVAFFFIRLFKEREFKFGHERLKYLFYNNRSGTLVVSFPACTPNSANYNFIRTISQYKVDKLFFLDDFGSNHQGCYLIEEEVQQAVLRVLGSLINGGGYNRIVFIGSSKGGYSALYYSFLIPNVIAVIGAPQYFLGRYLDKPNTEANLSYLLHMNVNDDTKKELDFRFKRLIETSACLPKKVYLHYSNQEHTFEDHVKWLLADLKRRDISIDEDISNYPVHGDLAKYFPPYLRKVLDCIL